MQEYLVHRIFKWWAIPFTSINCNLHERHLAGQVKYFPRLPKYPPKTSHPSGPDKKKILSIVLIATLRYIEYFDDMKFIEIRAFYRISRSESPLATGLHQRQLEPKEELDSCCFHRGSGQRQSTSRLPSVPLSEDMSQLPCSSQPPQPLGRL